MTGVAARAVNAIARPCVAEWLRRCSVITHAHFFVASDVLRLAIAYCTGFRNAVLVNDFMFCVPAGISS